MIFLEYNFSEENKNYTRPTRTDSASIETFPSNCYFIFSFSTFL